MAAHELVLLAQLVVLGAEYRCLLPRGGERAAGVLEAARIPAGEGTPRLWPRGEEQARPREEGGETHSSSLAAI